MKRFDVKRLAGWSVNWPFCWRCIFWAASWQPGGALADPAVVGMALLLLAFALKLVRPATLQLGAGS